MSDPVNAWSIAPAGSRVQRILQAQILEWVAMPFSRGIFLIQGLKLCLLSLLYWQVSSLLESPEVKVKAVQSCLTLCEPMDGSPWNSPGQNTGVGSLPLFQCIFPIQESNQGLLHCRWVLPTEPSGSYLGSLFTFKPEELFK